VAEIQTRYLSNAMAKREAAQSSEILVSNLHTMQYNNPENHKFYLHLLSNGYQGLVPCK
jgi:hypothetical protein